MSKIPDRPANQAEGSEGFYSRWSKRKLHEQPQQRPEKEISAAEQRTEKLESSPVKAVLGDQDMPDLDSLNEESDYSCFLSPGVSDTLRQLALRKLFGGQGFNLCDGLDDYDEEFTSFEKLGDIVTSDMRYRLEQEAERKIQLAAENENIPLDSVTNSDEVAPQATEPSENAVTDSTVQSLPDDSDDSEINENFNNIETKVPENKKLS